MKRLKSVFAVLSVVLVLSPLLIGCSIFEKNDSQTHISAFNSYLTNIKSSIGKDYIENYLKENPKFDCAKYNKGDVVTYGKFEQDNNTENGSEPIEWIVLEADNLHLLLISKYGLYPASYHWENTKYKYTTWETSSIREWLNGKFYTNAFSEEEKQFIALNKIVNKDNERYGIDGGNDTEDYVYFLSYDETLKYLPQKEQRRVKPTDYAIAKGAYINKFGYGYWWLRTPGIYRCNAEYAFESGEIYEYGSDVGHDNVCCRPVIRIERNTINK